MSMPSPSTSPGWPAGSLWYLDPDLAGGFLNTHVLFHPNSWHRGQLKLTQGRTHSCDNIEN